MKMKQRILTLLFLACAICPAAAPTLLAQITPPDPVYAKKSAEIVDADHVKLTLESFVSGNNVASDSALVMDLSATMDDAVSGKYVFDLTNNLTQTTQDWKFNNIGDDANNPWFYLHEGEYYPVHRANNLPDVNGRNQARAMWICLDPDQPDDRKYLSGTGLADDYDHSITTSNVTIYSGTLYRGWTCANVTNAWYKLGNNYHQIEAVTVNNTRQLAIHDTPYYLNGNTYTTDINPYATTSNNISLYFGDLYIRRTAKRSDYLKLSVEALLDALSADSKSDDLHHRVSLIQFNNNQWSNGGSDVNKPYLAPSPLGGTNSHVISDFLDITVDENLLALKNALTLPDHFHGSSHYEYGMSLAKGLFERELGPASGTDIDVNGTIETFEQPTLTGNDHVNYANRPKIVIIVGDCIATSRTAAETMATNLKSVPGTIVFVVYVNTNHNYLENYAYKWASRRDLVSIVDEFDETLVSTFRGLAREIREALIVLGAGTVVQDAIADGFEIPDASSDIKVYTADYATGHAKEEMTFGDPVLDEGTYVPMVSTDGSGRQVVSVSGFDFSENYCATVGGVPHGKKLILEVKVARTNAVGGLSTVTNVMEQSGMKYSADGDFVFNFENPSATLPVDIVIQKKGLVKGESAVFTVSPIDGDGNPISSVHVNDADVPVKPHRVILTGTAADGSAAVSATLKHLNGNCNWLVTEEGWSWDYVVNGGNASLSTATQLLNPFVFTNVKQNTTIKSAESKVTNDFGNNSVTPVKSKEP